MASNGGVTSDGDDGMDGELLSLRKQNKSLTEKVYNLVNQIKVLEATKVDGVNDLYASKKSRDVLEEELAKKESLLIEYAAKANEDEIKIKALGKVNKELESDASKKQRKIDGLIITKAAGERKSESTILKLSAKLSLMGASLLVEYKTREEMYEELTDLMSEVEESSLSVQQQVKRYDDARIIIEQLREEHRNLKKQMNSPPTSVDKKKLAQKVTALLESNTTSLDKGESRFVGWKADQCIGEIEGLTAQAVQGIGSINLGITKEVETTMALNSRFEFTHKGGAWVLRKAEAHFEQQDVMGGIGTGERHFEENTTEDLIIPAALGEVVIESSDMSSPKRKRKLEDLLKL